MTNANGDSAISSTSGIPTCSHRANAASNSLSCNNGPNATRWNTHRPKNTMIHNIAIIFFASFHVMWSTTTKIPKQRQSLVDEFTQRNSKINLSAIRDPQDVYNKHILDALEIKKIEKNISALQTQSNKNINACDLGTWWWFPLLPLAMTYPHIRWTGLDARNKKISAINDIISSLSLDNCKAIHSRVEDHAIRYDIVTARAVAYADTLLPRVDQILKPWGVAIFYKLFTSEEDNILTKYWRDIEINHTYTLWDDVERILYVLKKPQ